MRRNRKTRKPHSEDHRAESENAEAETAAYMCRPPSPSKKQWPFGHEVTPEGSNQMAKALFRKRRSPRRRGKRWGPGRVGKRRGVRRQSNPSPGEKMRNVWLFGCEVRRLQSDAMQASARKWRSQSGRVKRENGGAPHAGDRTQERKKIVCSSVHSQRVLADSRNPKTNYDEE